DQSEKVFVEYGSGVLVPNPHPLVAAAKAENDMNVLFRVPPGSQKLSASLQLPDKNGARSAPEVVHPRHKNAHGKKVDLSKHRNVDELVRRGGYMAQHYVDHTADGFVEARCPALAVELPRNVPAYSLVTGPDFFCVVSQAELLEWTKESLPSKFANT